MAYFTDDNTEGCYSPDELKTLNTVMNRLISKFGGVDEKNIGDAINNSWGEGDNSESALFTRAEAKL